MFTRNNISLDEFFEKRQEGDPRRASVGYTVNNGVVIGGHNVGYDLTEIYVPISEGSKSSRGDCGFRLNGTDLSNIFAGKGTVSRWSLPDWEMIGSTAYTNRNGNAQLIFRGDGSYTARNSNHPFHGGGVNVRHGRWIDEDLAPNTEFRFSYRSGGAIDPVPPLNTWLSNRDVTLGLTYNGLGGSATTMNVDIRQKGSSTHIRRAIRLNVHNDGENVSGGGWGGGM